ncbi:hypothetical protein HG444_001035 [Candidatus Saccharibacteria bacterium]|nr:hypothetical protein [Candidatus Saccharibacteria bacterium]
MSNTTAATLAQNEIALAGQKLPSERLDPENNERMSVIKIGRMRKHLSVKKSQQWVKAILSLNAGVTYEAEGYIGTLLGLDATKNTQAVELGVNAIREAVYLVTSKDDHDPEPTDDIAGFSGGEVWLITEKVTDEQTVLLGIVNQKRKGGALEILPIQNQLQSLFDLVVLIAATISSNAIPEESKGEIIYLRKELLEALSNKQGGQGVVTVMRHFGFHTPDDTNPKYRGKFTRQQPENLKASIDNLSQDLLEREEGYWQRVAANQQQRNQAA